MRKNSKQDMAQGRTPMDAAMRYLGYSARTVREVERHLDGKQFGEVEISDTVERLMELRLLDDAAYCEAFVSSRLRAKPISRQRLRRQLKEHEAEESAIADALAHVTDEVERANARAVAEKYQRQFAGMEPAERRRRVQARLQARGFDYDTIRMVTEGLEEGS